MKMNDCPHLKLLLAQDCFRDGWHHYSQGDCILSIDFFQHAVKIREGLLGSDDPHTGHVYCALGWAMYKLRQKPEQALLYFRRAWRIFAKAWSLTHQLARSAFCGIQLSLRQAGMGEKAATQYSFLLLESFQHQLHGDKAAKDNKKESALEHYRAALLFLEDEALGMYSCDAGDVYNQIGRLFETSSSPRAALDWYCKAYGVYNDAVGVDHPATIRNFQTIKRLRQESYWWRRPLLLHCIFPGIGNATERGSVLYA
jgi:tetratricopeptide (TPR) repeat protein